MIGYEIELIEILIGWQVLITFILNGRVLISIWKYLRIWNKIGIWLGWLFFSVSLKNLDLPSLRDFKYDAAADPAINCRAIFGCPSGTVIHLISMPPQNPLQFTIRNYYCGNKIFTVLDFRNKNWFIPNIYAVAIWRREKMPYERTWTSSLSAREFGTL